jgi:hypothetical protein
MTAQSGDVLTTATNTFGYYRFKSVSAGETYVFTAFSKCCSFEPQVVTVQENLTGLNFEAMQYPSMIDQSLLKSTF